MQAGSVMRLPIQLPPLHCATCFRGLVVLLIILSLSLDTASGQVLEKARSEATTSDVSSNSTSSAGSSSPHENCSSSDDSSSGWGEMLAPLFEPMVLGMAWAVSSPYWAPYAWLGDSFDREGQFPLYPYFQGDGFLCFDECGREFRPWAVETQFEYGTAFRDIEKFGLYARLSTAQRFDFDIRWDEWTEERRLTTDHLSLGRFNALFRFAQSRRVLMRSGLGINWMVGQDAAAGVNFHYGAQFFPAEPFVASAEINWGTLGYASEFEARATLGLLWRGCEIYSGFDWTFIGKADLHAAIFGLKFYF